MSVDIHVLNERCKGCKICIEVCQVEVLILSQKQNANGYNYPIVQNVEKCIDCGLCEMFCPDFAIWVTSEEEVTG